MDSEEKWISKNLLTYKVTGGRDGGYRGYTYKRNIIPGRWRVEVITEDKLLLSRLTFNIIKVDRKDYQLKTVYR